MGGCPGLTFSLVAKVFAKGKMFLYIYKFIGLGDAGFSDNQYLFFSLKKWMNEKRNEWLYFKLFALFLMEYDIKKLKCFLVLKTAKTGFILFNIQFGIWNYKSELGWQRHRFSLYSHNEK